MKQSAISKIQSHLNQLSSSQIFLLLVFLGFLAYSNAVFHPFVHDDVVFIEKNPHIANLSLRDIFYQTAIYDPSFPLVNTYYRPLLELYNRVLYQIFGLNPYGFHFANIFIHIINGFLVYNLVNVICKRKKVFSLGIAVLFILHPVQTEAVACISGISNLLFACLCMASLYLYLISEKHVNQRRGLTLYLLGLAVFFFALLAKEQSAILPLLLLLYEGCLSKSVNKVKVLRISGYFVILLGYFLLRKALFGHALNVLAGPDVELKLRLLSIPQALLIHFGNIFFPHNLHYYRSIDMMEPFALPLFFLMIIITAVVFIVRYVNKPYRKLLIFGLAWFVLSMLPTINIIPLVNEYSLLLTSEHFVYFPMVGLLLFVFCAASYWLDANFKEKAPLAGFLTVTVLSGVFTIATVRQNTFWRAEIPLFQRTLQFQPHFGRVRMLLAKAYYTNGQYQQALEEYTKGLHIFQGYLSRVKNEKVRGFYLRFIKGNHLETAHTYEALGDPKGALAHYKQALDIPPEEDGLIHSNMGLNYLKVNDIHSAVKHFEQAVAFNKNDLMAVNSLAISYIEIGEFKRAEQLLRYIVQQDPQSVSARQNLEKLLSR